MGSSLYARETLAGRFTKPTPVQKEGVYGGTWFPRQIARGPRCGAALHFRRNAAIVGVSGHIPASGRTTGILAPTIFLWYRQAAPSLFLKKRWWGRKHPSWRGLEMRPAAAEIGLAASAARVSPSVDFADSSPVRERRDEVHPSPQQRAEAPLQEIALVRLGPGVFLPDGPAQPIGVFRAGDELRQPSSQGFRTESYLGSSSALR